MAVDADQALRVPIGLDSWEELNRRCSGLSQQTYTMIKELQDKVVELETRIEALENP